jgi:seryl-tRNA synthetase
LTVVREMEAQAQQQYLGKIKELEDSLNQTQEKLQSLQKARGSASATILTAEQQAELENFRKKAVETRLELKDLRKNLRLETDRLELWTKAINIALIPLLVAVVGLVLALVRRGRARAS